MQLPPVPAKHCVLSRDQPPKFTPTTKPTEVARALPVAVLEFNALAFQSVCFKTGDFEVDYLLYYYDASNILGTPIHVIFTHNHTSILHTPHLHTQAPSHTIISLSAILVQA